MRQHSVALDTSTNYKNFSENLMIAMFVNYYVYNRINNVLFVTAVASYLVLSAVYFHLFSLVCVATCDCIKSSCIDFDASVTD